MQAERHKENKSACEALKQLLIYLSVQNVVRKANQMPIFAHYVVKNSQKISSSEKAAV